MNTYVLIKKSQIDKFKKIPFYYQPNSNEFLLYKKEGETLDPDRKKHPDLFILKADKEKALEELTAALNKDLAKQIESGSLPLVKNALTSIVTEALTPDQSKALESLPDTIEILLGGFGGDHGLMGYLSKLATNSHSKVEHSINVTALTFQYCFFHKMPDHETRQLALGAMLHDLGTSKIEKNIVESQERLTDKEFKLYTTHTEKGHDILIEDTDFDVSVATIALEHHERIDGSGYPNGVHTVSEASQLIGLIDCYEPLTYLDKSFRKAKTPFETLMLLKKEVIGGRFSASLFKEFASCLVK